MAVDATREGALREVLPERPESPQGFRALLTWRMALAATGALVCLLIIAYSIVVTSQRDTEAYSHHSWSYTTTGFRGVFETCQRLGYDVGRHQKNYSLLPPPHDTALLTLDPSDLSRLFKGEHFDVEGRNAQWLREWVEAGGHLIATLPGRTVVSVLGFEIATDVPLELDDPDEVLPYTSSAASLRQAVKDLPATTAAPDPSGALRGEGPLSGHEWTATPFEPPFSIALRPYLLDDDDSLPVFKMSAPYAPLIQLEGDPIVLERALGDGKVIVVSTPLPFANAALRLDDWGEIAVRLLHYGSDQGERRLVFDEYTHGIWQRGGALRWAWETPLFYPLCTCLLLVIFFAWRGAVRFGSPAPPPAPSRRAKEEFVLNLAELYRRGDHRLHALHLLSQGYNRHLDRVLGGSASTSSEPPHRFGLHIVKQQRVTTDSALLGEGKALHQRYLEILDSLRKKKNPAETTTEP